MTGEQPAPPETVSRSSGITTGQGGVFTEDVGVITGALTIRTDLTGTEVTVRVQYKDADEWYVVRGGHGKLADPADLDAVHGIVTGILDRPGDV